jgi:hypothetical protein
MSIPFDSPAAERLKSTDLITPAKPGHVNSMNALPELGALTIDTKNLASTGLSYLVRRSLVLLRYREATQPVKSLPSERTRWPRTTETASIVPTQPLQMRAAVIQDRARLICSPLPNNRPIVWHWPPQTPAPPSPSAGNSIRSRCIPCLCPTAS